MCAGILSPRSPERQAAAPDYLRSQPSTAPAITVCCTCSGSAANRIPLPLPRRSHGWRGCGDRVGRPDLPFDNHPRRSRAPVPPVLSGRDQALELLQSQSRLRSPAPMPDEAIVRIWQLHDCLSITPPTAMGSRRGARVLHVLRARWQCLEFGNNLAERIKHASR
jgi:hypothetical protein